MFLFPTTNRTNRASLCECMHVCVWGGGGGGDGCVCVCVGGCTCTHYYYYWSLLYSATLCSPAGSLCSCHMWFWMSDCSLLMCIFSNIHQSGVLTVLSGCCMAGAMWNTAVSAHFLCTPYNHALVHSVTSSKATWVGCMCVLLQPATCTSGTMTGIFCVHT